MAKIIQISIPILPPQFISTNLHFHIFLVLLQCIKVNYCYPAIVREGYKWRVIGSKQRAGNFGKKRRCIESFLRRKVGKSREFRPAFSSGSRRHPPNFPTTLISMRNSRPNRRCVSNVSRGEKWPRISWKEKREDREKGELFEKFRWFEFPNFFFLRVHTTHVVFLIQIHFISWFYPSPLNVWTRILWKGRAYGEWIFRGFLK